MQTIKTKFFEYGHQEIEYLTCVDEVLGKAIQKLGKVNREVIPDLFTALIHAIVGQQISAKATVTVWNRMQESFLMITPKIISLQSVEKIQQCGLSTRKAMYIKKISEAVESGEIELELLPLLSDTEVIKKLSSLNGVGVWTAEMLLLNAMERQDIVSYGDIAIRRGMIKLYGLTNMDKKQFEIYKSRYSPYGSIASIYLWKLSLD